MFCEHELFKRQIQLLILNVELTEFINNRIKSRRIVYDFGLGLGLITYEIYY